MASPLPRPGVEVEQQFKAGTPSLIQPILGAVFIGEACQIEENEAAGLFSNVQQDYSYPKLFVGATVVLAEVVVELVAAEGTFDITKDPVVTVAATKVTVGKDPSPQSTLQANTQVTVAAGQELEDLTKDFFTLGAKIGCVVLFEDDASDLVKVTSKQSDNLGDWIITALTGKSKLALLGKTPGHLTGTVEETYEVIAGTNDRLVVDIDGSGDIEIVLTPGSAATAQDIVDDINADPTFAAIGLADVFERKVRIRSKTLGSASSVTIGFTSPSANDLLGFTLAQTDAGSDADSLKAETDVEYSIVCRGSTTGTIQLSYRACRTDEALEFISAQDTATIVSKVGKIDPKNPLAFAMAQGLAATDLAVFGVIVKDKDSTTSHQAALDFLGSKEVYAMVPLSNNSGVHSLYQSHVDLYSQPANKKERIVFINPTITDFKEYQKSQQTASSPIGTPPTNRFTDAAAKFQDNGVPVGAVLSVTATDNPLEIDSVVRTLPFEIQLATVISETIADIVGQFTADPGKVTYSVKSKNFNQSEKALTQAGIAEGFNNKRVIQVHPDVVKYSVDGAESEQPGYFAAAAAAGMISGLLASQPFSSLPVPNVIGVKGSNDVMSELDLNILAGGGVFILVQDVVGGPIIIRHQLTTAVGDLKTRELSVTKAVDFSAKYFRNELDPLTGKYNLSDEYLEQQLRPAAAGVIKDLVRERIIHRKTEIVSMKIVGGGDTVEVVIDFVVFLPVNKVRVILQIGTGVAAVAA